MIDKNDYLSITKNKYLIISNNYIFIIFNECIKCKIIDYEAVNDRYFNQFNSLRKYQDQFYNTYLTNAYHLKKNLLTYDLICQQRKKFDGLNRNDKFDYIIQNSKKRDSRIILLILGESPQYIFIKRIIESDYDLNSVFKLPPDIFWIIVSYLN